MIERLISFTLADLGAVRMAPAGESEPGFAGAPMPHRRAGRGSGPLVAGHRAGRAWANGPSFNT